MGRSLIVSAALLLLAACGMEQSAGPFNEASVSTTEAAMDMAAEESARGGAAPAAAPAPPGEGDGAQNQPGQAPGAAQPAPVRHLAYTYNVGVEAPAERIAGVMDAHAQACAQAGPAVCQTIGSQRHGDPDTRVSGQLEIRGQPAWLRTFMTRLETDAAAAGGRIRSQSTSTEDLTRAIVDTEATLRAQRALRDRLQRLLESRPGRLSDLLEVERELARVQGQIDSYESNLAVMRTRVDMSLLTISYESSPRAVGRDTFRPLTEAFAGFLGFIVAGFAAIITLIAVLIPWAAFAALIVWALLWVRKKRGGRLLPRRAPPQAEN